jgi:hypothetical protein
MYCALYHVPCAVGMSTVWSILYGVLLERTHVDHILFWAACGSVVIPAYLSDPICRQYNLTRWHHQQKWPFIATGAHFLAALCGFLLSYALNPRSISIN